MSEPGANVRTLREERGWSQEELARRSGFSAFTISKIERGATKEPGAYTLDKIASALGVTSSRLIRGTDADSATPDSSPV